MSQRVKRNLPMLKWLSKANAKTRKAVIQSADRDLVDTICECALNVLKGNVPLKPSQKQRLSKYKKVLRRLASGKKSSLQTKRRLIQTGGFLPQLLFSVAAPLLKAVVGGAL